MARVNSFEELAAEAAERITEMRAEGQQLTFLPDEAKPADSERSKRGKGKATSQLRDWCSARGFRMPEDVLIEMAGMAAGDDAFLAALARTEQVLAWATAGARQVGYVFDKDRGCAVEREMDTSASMTQRLATFQFVFTAQLRAVEALLPYGLAKVTPEVQVNMPVQIVMPGGVAPANRAETARDITPQPRRMAPPPLPHEMQQNQRLAPAENAGDASDIRTEGPSR